MRTKNLVKKHLSQTQLILSAIKTGMETKSINPDQVYNLILNLEKELEFITEKVDLEPDY